jgi:hypothetical protein
MISVLKEQSSRRMFRWSTIHTYIWHYLKIIPKIIHCYEDIQVILASIDVSMCILWALYGRTDPIPLIKGIIECNGRKQRDVDINSFLRTLPADTSDPNQLEDQARKLRGRLGFRIRQNRKCHTGLCQSYDINSTNDRRNRRGKLERIMYLFAVLLCLIFLLLLSMRYRVMTI